MDDSDNVICILGLDPSQLGDNARITVEKMASGGEAFILHIESSGETTHVQAGMQAGESTGPGSSTVHEVVKVTPSRGSVAPVRTLSNAKITPVQAYTRNETVVTKAISSTTQTEDSDTDSDDPIESQDPHCQEYVIVHLPEGSSIKQYQARPLHKMRNPVDDAVTMDADGFYMCVDCDHK